MALSPFDFSTNILKKQDRFDDDVIQKEYSQWMLNKIMSCDPDNIFLANELNKYGNISNKMSYDTYYYYLKKSSKFIKYLCKKPQTETEILHIMKYYQVNQNVAKQYREHLSDEEVKAIVDGYEKKGTKK